MSLLFLPKDVIRLLFSFIPHRQRRVVAQVCRFLWSCSTTRERLTWAVGPPDDTLKNQLATLSHQLSPGFLFEFSNYCLDCGLECNVQSHNCFYQMTMYCHWCRRRLPLWHARPWSMKVDFEEYYFAHYELKCVACHDALPYFVYTSCLNCDTYFCASCRYETCIDCGVRTIYSKKSSRKDVAEHVCDTSVARWKHLIKESLNHRHVSFSVNIWQKQYVLVWNCGTCIQVWVFGNMETPAEVAKNLSHNRSKKSDRIFEIEDFLVYTATVEPIPTVAVAEQIVKRVSLHEYLQSMEE